MYIGKAYTHGTGGHLKYSNVESTEQKVNAMQPMPGAVRPWTQYSVFIKNPPVTRPYHVLPMFQHVPVPLVDMEMFRPDSERRHLPNLLTNLLVPQVNPQFNQVSPVRNTRGVEVWCGYSKISVRMNKYLLGFRGSASSFHLGTCPVSRSDKNFLYFHYDLNDCDSSLKMMNGQIVYSNTVCYTPEPQGTVIRALPLTLDIQCLYNRFHYSYKIGFLPVVREHMFHKIFESSAKFSISVCNERWESFEENGSFVLGEPMYFEVSAAHTSKDERIFVDSCYATASKDRNSTPQYNVISNYGWDELYTDASVCACCDSICEIEETSYLPHLTQSMITSLPWILDKNEQSLIETKEGLVGVQADTAEVMFKSAKGIGEEEEDDGYPVEIVTDTEKQMEAKEENKKMPMKDLDEDVEVIVGTEETTATEFKDEEGDRSGTVMSDGEQMDRVVEFKEDSGRLKNTSRTEQPKVRLIEELSEDVNDDKVSNKSGQNELIYKTREELSQDEIQPEGLEKNMHVQSTVPSHMVIDEERFLNGKQEPIEWNKDEH
ncbi:Zona pellucida sperm-binding protein 3 [Anabarilius grahami]|uniref:Zona pellucida sperm-binding protein 3 n=1 Tax=Anabarilius grahami TaxID=495550 RepID=A0A3N0Y5C5_ANAGA|nr:Zona pellucida sperm-binding protein 3 [Anabarilius grahami]